MLYLPCHYERLPELPSAKLINSRTIWGSRNHEVMYSAETSHDVNTVRLQKAKGAARYREGLYLPKRSFHVLCFALGGHARQEIVRNLGLESLNGRHIVCDMKPAAVNIFIDQLV